MWTRSEWNRSELRLGRRVLAVVAGAAIVALGPAEGTPSRPSDQQIAAAIERRLLSDPLVPGLELSVESRDGEVALSGTVRTLLAKERAGDLAAAVRGVTSVVNAVQVRSGHRPDAEIRRDVERALLDDPATDEYQVRADVGDGVVTLAGRANSWPERRLAAEIAKAVPGVREVRNEITVAFTADRTDGAIEADVGARLNGDPWVDDGLVDVSVQDGVVRLSGAVGSVEEWGIAHRDAWVAGVKDVDASGLEVKWWARDRMAKKAAPATDEQLGEAVRGALMREPRLVALDVRIAAEDGVVTLDGLVESAHARRLARQRAEEVPGVRDVRDRLDVRQDGDPPADAELAERVRRSLADDPLVGDRDLRVTVRDGSVRITGTVESAAERQRIQQLAGKVKAVSEVRSDVRVRARKVADEEVAEEIRWRLATSPYVDETAVRVEVKDGEAVLSGRVASRLARRRAEQAALEAGARAVRNELEIGPADDGGGPAPPGR